MKAATSWMSRAGGLHAHAHRAPAARIHRRPSDRRGAVNADPAGPVTVRAGDARAQPRVTSAGLRPSGIGPAAFGHAPSFGTGQVTPGYVAVPRAEKDIEPPAVPRPLRHSALLRPPPRRTARRHPLGRCADNSLTRGWATGCGARKPPTARTGRFRTSGEYPLGGPILPNNGDSEKPGTVYALCSGSLLTTPRSWRPAISECWCAGHRCHTRRNGLNCQDCYM